MILGSATPSLESRHLAEEGAFTLLRLPERYTGLPLPEVEILDLRNFAAPGRRSIGARGEEPRLIAPPLLDAARAALERGDQVLFFLNRRGFAPHTQCRACGAGISCPNCRVSLVFHAPEQAHLCHYCGYRAGGAGHLPVLRRRRNCASPARGPSAWSWRSARPSRGARCCASTATPPRARAPARRWSPISRAAAPTSSSGRSWSPRGCTSRG